MSTVGNDTTTDWEMMSNDSELNSGDSSDTRTRSVGGCMSSQATQ